MAQSLPNTFRDTGAITLRSPEVPNADWTNGMNNGLCAPGIGVAFGMADLYQDPSYLPNIGAPSGWTLLDQDGAARVPQVSQSLGGVGYAADTDYPLSGGAAGKGVEFIVAVGNPTQAAKDADPDVDGTVTVLGTANLQSLAVGWTNTPI